MTRSEHWEQAVNAQLAEMEMCMLCRGGTPEKRCRHCRAEAHRLVENVAQHLRRLHFQEAATTLEQGAGPDTRDQHRRGWVDAASFLRGLAESSEGR